MELVTMLATVVTFPIVCLGFLLWMAHLEDTLPAAVRRTGRQPDPAPIREVPVGPESPQPAAHPHAGHADRSRDMAPVHRPPAPRPGRRKAGPGPVSVRGRSSGADRGLSRTFRTVAARGLDLRRPRRS